ncbi:MAG TPA: galactose mutarotase [Polyangiaceae bacterium]|nr:galactose mutarotase [Polyangiaceae bacterium]
MQQAHGMFTVKQVAANAPVLGELVTLRDEAADAEVTVAPRRGALVTSFRVGSRELLYLDEATLLDETQNVRGGIPVLFPTPGKLENDTWHFADKSGRLKQHGFARNLAWTVARESTLDGAAVTLTLDSSPATLGAYPWEFHTELTLTLRGATLRSSSKVQNRATTPLPFAFGYHPYFAVGDKSRLAIDTRATRAFDNVTKREIAFTGFDLTAPEVDLHLLDHGSTESALHLGDGSRVRVAASPDFVRWVIWTKADKDFVCLEPWTAPGNALNTGESLCVLPPGTERESWVEIGWIAAQ